jgi:lycopene cyclase domain-containing protein
MSRKDGTTMTYFAFLGWFIGIPLLLLLALAWWDQRRGLQLPPTLQSWPFVRVVIAHIIVAVLYTTPWDNYLVATRVWWYDPALVVNIVIGWVPIEEYTFFVVQTILTSLWLLALARRYAPPSTAETDQVHPQRALRIGAAGSVGLIWLGSVVMLASGWRPGTYLGLELVWALPPIIFQLGFGADILWHYRRIVFWGLLVPTVYLAATDTIAIGAGTWTIDPAQSTGILIGTLPLEELIFFLVTNVLVIFGTVLVLADTSQSRVPVALRRYLARPAQAERLGIAMGEWGR